MKRDAFGIIRDALDSFVFDANEYDDQAMNRDRGEALVALASVEEVVEVMHRTYHTGVSDCPCLQVLGRAPSPSEESGE